MSSADSGYRSLLRIPGAAAFFLPAAVGRVGIAMTGASLVWLVHARTGSYATAGLATAGFAVAEALIGPQLARLIDRFGQTRVLPFSLLAHGVAIAGVLAVTSPAALIVCATGAGAAIPQLGSLSAARWPHLLRAARPGDLTSALSLESVANAIAFLLGPVLAAALGAAGHAAMASAIAAALILGGGSLLAAQPRTAPLPAHTSTEGTGLLSPAFLLLALLNLALGLYFGTMSISVSAFATGHGVPGAAAPVLAAASLSGLLSGWLYGRRTHRVSAHRQLVIASAYLTGTALLLPIAPSAICLGATSVLTGAAITPLIVLLNVRTERSVRRTALTQAFTWNNSASSAGSALAASLAGRVADHLGTSAAFALAPAAGLILLALSITAQHRSPGKRARP